MQKGERDTRYSGKEEEPREEKLEKKKMKHNMSLVALNKIHIVVDGFP